MKSGGSRRQRLALGGGSRNRTDDNLLAKQALCQLSYAPDSGSPPDGTFSIADECGPSPVFSRKEVIQPQVPLRLPCYDFTPVMKHTVVSGLLTVTLPTSGIPHSHGVTGGVYKTRERIHRGMLIRDY